jgi:Ribbon-helix-helix domain
MEAKKNDLKNRQRFSNTIPPVLKTAFDNLSTLTRIPKSRLFDEAIVDLILKYQERAKIESEAVQAKFNDLVEDIKDFM